MLARPFAVIETRNDIKTITAPIPSTADLYILEYMDWRLEELLKLKR